MRPESVPLLVVALLLLSVQPGVDSFTTVVGGSQDVETPDDAVLVVDGNVSVQTGTEIDSSLYVIGGTARIDGTVSGDVFQLAGTVTVGETAAVDGTYRVLGGNSDVAEGAAVDVDAVAEPFTRQRSPAEAVGVFLIQATGLALVSFVLGRRYDDLLANVGHSIRRHPVVSGTVGLLTTVTLLALFVFMAFTLILIPVSVLGLVGLFLVYLYGYVSVGFVLGDLLDVNRPGVTTALGTVAFLTVTEVLGLVPLIGGLVPLVALVVAMGAVVVTYFGLRQFSTPVLRSVE